MITVLDHISKKLNCPTHLVRYRLMYQENADLISKYIQENGPIETTYRDRNGQARKINCSGVTITGAHLIKAFGDLIYPFNISIAAYYFAHHNIRLLYPFHQCVIERTCTEKGICERYYPLELLRFSPPTSPSPSTISSHALRHTQATESLSTFSICTQPPSEKASDTPTPTPRSSRPGILWLEVEGHPNRWERRKILLFFE
ncbi:PAZ domain-containing protein [Meloidogyne graminicola]|uniref:PAZ domain-containing protein n=1 Tax=Meloidogyne graminicola TaxID=189291 RepID=A0A8S9Z7E3_9BILA|nr:PAZ domain-containing protein [Meloidogyne graminicola]